MLKISLRVNKYISLLVVVMLLCGAFCGCTGTLEDSANTDTITFTDALNRKISICKTPGRVAALIGSFAEVWQLSGGEVCATAEDAWDDFDLDLPDCVNIGGAHSPNAEMLFSANPDFVIASASTASNVELMSLLENAGITVAYFDVDSFEDYMCMLKICTDITGRADLYQKNGIEVKNKIDSIKKKLNLAEITSEERKVLILRASSGSVKAKGSEGTVLGEMLKDMGCVNIADSDQNILESLSVESVIRQNPYHIFIVTMGDDRKAMQSLENLFSENPAWGMLDAVKENRLHIMERKLFNIKPNADWAVSYEKLSEILLGNSQ